MVRFRSITKNEMRVSMVAGVGLIAASFILEVYRLVPAFAMNSFRDFIWFFVISYLVMFIPAFYRDFGQSPRTAADKMVAWCREHMWAFSALVASVGMGWGVLHELGYDKIIDDNCGGFSWPDILAYALGIVTGQVLAIICFREPASW